MNSVDMLVGRRVRHGRWIAGVSQSELAKNLNVSVQQVQDFETGNTQISATYLFKIAEVINVSVVYFFPVSKENAKDLRSETQKVSRANVEKDDLYERLVGRNVRLEPKKQQEIVTMLQSMVERDLCCAGATYQTNGPE